MAFPENILTDNETIVRQFRPHWRMLAIPTLWLIGAIVAIVVVFAVLPLNDNYQIVQWILTAGIVVAMIPLAASPVLRWVFTTYVLTSERLITRSGMIARSGIELPLASINDVRFSQNVIERILKSGDLVIESAGESGQSKFSDIPDPEEFQGVLYKTREQQQRASAAAESAIAADINRDPTEQLERAARLRADGVLSEEEFQEMKRRILGTTD